MSPLNQAEPLLATRGLTVDYKTGRRSWRHAVDKVDLTINPSDTLGLVGESGSGKSSVARAILGLVPLTSGEIMFDGHELRRQRLSRRDSIADIQAVFQDPYSSLDPTKTAGYSIAEPLLARAAAQGPALSRSQVAERVQAMLERVGLPASAASEYPASYSGGQRQRIAIARALIVQPRLVVLDEAVSALDLSMQAHILNLLVRLQRSEGMSYLFISHDLRVVEHISGRVVVLYRGRVVEAGATRDVYAHPQHPYTRALTAAAPAHDPGLQRERRERRAALRRAGPPAPLGECCPYAHRCPFAIRQCNQVRPELQVSQHGTSVACIRLGDPELAEAADGAEIAAAPAPGAPGLSGSDRMPGSRRAAFAVECPAQRLSGLSGAEPDQI